MTRVHLLPDRDGLFVLIYSNHSARFGMDQMYAAASEAHHRLSRTFVGHILNTPALDALAGSGALVEEWRHLFARITADRIANVALDQIQNKECLPKDRACQRWVISVDFGLSAPSPLTPHKQTFGGCAGMSEKCQEETSPPIELLIGRIIKLAPAVI